MRPGRGKEERDALCGPHLLSSAAWQRSLLKDPFCGYRHDVVMIGRGERGAVAVGSRPGLAAPLCQSRRTRYDQTI